ncbi:zinc-ribbon domain-containing protein [Thomasclavelia sp.]|uniref:zinc-ribbon domain-containing protein n=1 Tax=Thomasclavelia sp. TaxID=3025757 RepID=UPI0025F7FF50|nr:zinc ribbon domain-containing protein [Thomasclavelia sp.]
MFCTNCGKQIPDDARFCPECGAQTEPRANTASTANQANTYSQQNQGYNNYQQMNRQQNMNVSGAFKWGAGAIVWFVILILGCLASIGIYSQEEFLYMQLVGFNPNIVKILEGLALVAIVILIIKRLRLCIYAFYGLKLAEAIYIFMTLGAYMQSEMLITTVAGLLINVVITYLVLKNYWHQLS